VGNVGSFLSRFGGLQHDEALEAPSLLSTSAPNALGAFMDKFTTLTESYWFYDNTIELRFDTEDHKYYRVEELGNLTEIKGVTKTCHIIDRSVALTPWAAKKTAEKILVTMPVMPDDEGALFTTRMPIADFTKLVMEAKNAHKEILVEAGDIGHLAHKCLEDSIQYAIDNTGGVVLALRNLPSDEKAVHCANAAFDWMQQHKVRWIKTEQKIYSKEHEYAGTMDGTAFTSSCDDPSCCAKPFADHRSLIDWKSSNYLYIEYCYQTASYLAAEVEEYGIPFDDRWILRLGKNEDEAGKFEPWYLDASTFAEDFAGFLACLKLTKLVEAVTERMQVQKRGVRAAKKKVKAEKKEIAKMKAKVEREAEKAQKKIERAAERERIKAEAKKNREEAKLAAKNVRTAEVPSNGIPRQEVPGKDGDVGRPEPDNEVPRQAEDTQNAAVAAEVVAEVAPELAQNGQVIPVHEDVLSLTENGPASSASQLVYEEAPTVLKTFTIPEEG
jgi:hypothetical protein